MELHERIANSPVGPALLAANGNGDGGATDPFADLKNRIHLALVSELGPRLFDVEDSGAVRARVESEIGEQLSQEAGLSRDDRARLAPEIADDIFGYGPLERLLADPTVSEIMVNGPGRHLDRTRRPALADHADVHRLVAPTPDHHEDGRADRPPDRRVVADGRCPSAGRLTCERDHPAALALRSAADDSQVRAEPLPHGGADRDRHPLRGCSGFLQNCIGAKLNILISGGTGSGKTTLLNALSEAVPDSDRIVTIEDAAELQLHQRHVLRLESRPPNIEGEGEVTIRDLVRNALRMRPDRIIVGEVRGAEALDMLQAMNTGHEGSLWTVHANSPVTL